MSPEPLSAAEMAEALLARPEVSFWLKKAIRDSLARDPVDALNDVSMLLEIAKARCREVFS